MSGGDPYVYPGTRVLRNLAGLRDQRSLEEYERRVTSIRADHLASEPATGKFDLEHLKSIHKHIFQDVYPWAGQLRTVEISKGTTQFAPLKTHAHTLESWGGVLMAELKKEHHLAGLDRERFIDRLTHHTSELNFLHPFREGNGRTTREFVRQLAQHAGYQVDYQRIEPAEWNRAAAQSNDSTRAWRDLYDRATTSLRALSFERDPRHEALQWHPELKGAYAALDRANAAAERIADKQVRESFMAERRTEIAAILHTGRVIAAPQRQAEKTLDKPPAPRGFER